MKKLDEEMRSLNLRMAECRKQHHSLRMAEHLKSRPLAKVAPKAEAKEEAKEAPKEAPKEEPKEEPKAKKVASARSLQKARSEAKA